MENLAHGVCHLLPWPGRKALVGLGDRLALHPVGRRGEGTALGIGEAGARGFLTA